MHHDVIVTSWHRYYYYYYTAIEIGIQIGICPYTLCVGLGPTRQHHGEHCSVHASRVALCVGYTQSSYI